VETNQGDASTGASKKFGRIKWTFCPFDFFAFSVSAVFCLRVEGFVNLLPAKCIKAPILFAGTRPTGWGICCIIICACVREGRRKGYQCVILAPSTMLYGQGDQDGQTGRMQDRKVCLDKAYCCSRPCNRIRKHPLKRSQSLHRALSASSHIKTHPERKTRSWAIKSL